MDYHSHEHRKEIWNVVSGEGTVLLDGEERLVKQGDMVELPIGAKHKMTARTDMTIIEVQMGKSISREDKVKWEDG